MAEHSPLPWVVYSDRGDIKSSCKGLPEVAVAKVLGQETSGERKANAELIVRSVNAIPSLVNALEMARSQLVTLGGDVTVNQVWGDKIQLAVLAHIDAALASVKERA